MRLQEVVEVVGVVNVRNVFLERVRYRLQLEFADVLSDFRQARFAVVALDQKQRLFDKSLEDQKQKYEEFQAMLDIVQKEVRVFSTEFFKFRYVYEESIMSQEIFRRENENFRGILYLVWSSSGSREFRGVEVGFQSKVVFYRSTFQYCYGFCRFSFCRL